MSVVSDTGLLIDGRKGDVGTLAGGDRSFSSANFRGDSCERVRGLLLSASSMISFGARIVCAVPDFESTSLASDVG